MGLGLRGIERRTLAYRHIARMVRTTATMTLPAVLALAGCGGGGGGEDETPAATAEPPETTTAGAATDAPTGPRPCREDRHMVVFDFAGMLTLQDEAAVVNDWLNGDPPEPRPGAPELSQAYRERGYEILYLTAAPSDLMVDGLPVATAVQEWLGDNGFPTDPEGTSVLGYTGSGDVSAAILAITDELLRLASENVGLDAGYTDDEERVYPLASGGIPPERIYTIGPDAGAAGTTPLAGDDVQAHVGTVEELPPVCTPG